MTESLGRRLGRVVSSLRYTDLPFEVVSKAKSVMLHDLAVAFGGVTSDQTRIVLGMLPRLINGETVIGQAFKSSTEAAAFANSVMARALRMEDTIIPSFIHPGASLIPAALAVAERERVDGQTVITALVAGYEVLGRIAGSLWSWEVANRTSHHLFGAFGVAAVAARLMRLDLDQTVGALAHAANLAATITYGIQDVQYGIVTRNGLLAAELGRVRAPFPEDFLEGPYGFYAVQLGGQRPSDEEILRVRQPTDIMTAVLKPHPCTALNLVPISLAQRLIGAHDLAGDDITIIRVRRGRNVGRVPNIHSTGPFTGGAYSAISSLPFALSVLVAEGAVLPRHFEATDDPKYGAGMRKVIIDSVDELNLLEHHISIETRDGRRFNASGGAEVLSAPDPRALLETHAQPVIGTEKINTLLREMSALEWARDLTGVTECLA